MKKRLKIFNSIEENDDYWQYCQSLNPHERLRLLEQSQKRQGFDFTQKPIRKITIKEATWI